MHHDRTQAGRRTRVLVVDDSPTMRSLIGNILSADPAIEIAGYAADPYEARDAIIELTPDVLTLDVEMPRMDGLEFLERLMSRRPTPVVMVSSLTDKGARAAVDAMMLGAVDCVGKPATGDIRAAFADLPRIVKGAARASPPARRRLSAPPAGTASRSYDPGKLILIAASTGGVDALAEIIGEYPANCPPTLIVQHMPARFTSSLAARLNQMTPATVQEASQGAPLKPGHVYIAPGGPRHLTVEGRAALRCRLLDAPPEQGHRPSADVLFRSGARLGERVVGVVLTGIGGDGAEGLKMMRDAGAFTIGQDEATSAVYGMPRVAQEIGAVTVQLPLDRISQKALGRCAQGAGG